MIAQRHTDAFLASPFLDLVHLHARHFTPPVRLQFTTPHGALTLNPRQFRQGLALERATVPARLSTTPVHVQLTLSTKHVTLTPHPHAAPWLSISHRELTAHLHALDQAVLQAFITYLTSTWNITATLFRQHYPSPHALPHLLHACEHALIHEALPTLFALLFHPGSVPFVTQLCLGPDFLVLGGHPLQRQLHYTLSPEIHTLDAPIQVLRQRYPNAHPNM
jgi:hypothetical protein